MVRVTYFSIKLITWKVNLANLREIFTLIFKSSFDRTGEYMNKEETRDTCLIFKYSEM